MTFCITGNRPEKFPFDYANTASIEMSAYFMCIRALADEVLDRGFTRFLTGMARGVDLDFGVEMIKRKMLSKRYAGLTIEAAIPYPDQAARYDRESKKKYNFILDHADRVTYIANEYTKDCYLARDRYMVDKSDLVLAIWNEQKDGGTYYTIRYAEEKGRELRLVSLKTMR